MYLTWQVTKEKTKLLIENDRQKDNFLLLEVQSNGLCR